MTGWETPKPGNRPNADPNFLLKEIGKTFHSLGVPNQLPEVWASPHPGVQLHGDALQPAFRDGVCHQEEPGQYLGGSWKSESV